MPSDGKFAAAGAALAAIVLGACALTHLQTPAINAESVQLTEVALDEQRFIVHVHVDNPNDRALPIKSVSCTLQLADVEVGRGESAAPFAVPPHGDTDFDMLVTTNFAASMPNLLRRVIQRGNLPEYHLSGWVNPDHALLPPIPFTKSGQIRLQ